MDSLPPILQPDHPLIPASQVKLIQETLGNDPSKFKLNHVMAGKESLRGLEEGLASFHWGIKYLKILSQLAPYRSDFKELIQVCQNGDYGIIPYIGGSIIEDAIKDGNLPRVTKYLVGLGIDTVEISDSRGEFAPNVLKQVIRDLKIDFDRVLVEIGNKKDCACCTDYRDWEAALRLALDEEADEIILEGCGSGDAGIYFSRSGEPGIFLVEYLREKISDGLKRVIIEAPLQDQQDFWINGGYGWDVQVGNTNISQQVYVVGDRIKAMDPEFRENLAEALDLFPKLMGKMFRACEDVGLDPNRIMTSRDLGGMEFKNKGLLEEKFEQILDYIYRRGRIRKSQ